MTWEDTLIVIGLWLFLCFLAVVVWAKLEERDTCIHHWNLWGEPYEEPMMHLYTKGGVEISRQEYARIVQQRTCTLCGVCERRVVS